MRALHEGFTRKLYKKAIQKTYARILSEQRLPQKSIRGRDSSFSTLPEMTTLGLSTFE